MKFVMVHGEESRSLEITTMPIADAIACEKFADMTWVEWREALLEDRAVAVQFGWWLAGRRAGVVEKFSEVDIDLARISWSVELSDDERATAEADEPAADEATDAERPTGAGETPEQ
jgi:hypothetical protein